MTAEGLVPLPGTGWQVWSSAILRAPGFPADGLDRLAAPECAKLADAHLAGELEQDEFLVGFDTATRANAAHLRDIAADPRFREAVTWQSLTSVEALDALGRAGPEAPRIAKHRKREIVVTRYWQRYCAKNDTIGFFGPVCWVRFAATDTAGAAAVDARPGHDLLRRRVVDLEWRALTTLADTIAADPSYRPWLPVVRRPHLALHDGHLLRVGGPPQPMTPAAMALLAAADGTRTVAEVCAAACAEPGSGLRKEADARLLLAQLAETGVVHCGWRLPYQPDPAGALRRGLDAIGEPVLRTQALAALDRLVAARDALAAAAGDAEAVRTATRALETEYAALTGAPARHRPGATYAGRGVAFEDTERDLELTLRPAVLASLAPALAPVLQAARWLSVAIAEGYRSSLRELFEEAGGGQVPLGELTFLANGVMFAERLAGDIMADFTRRWSHCLGLDDLDPGGHRVDLSAAALATAVAAAFPASAPGWTAARLHSPDLHLCAPSVDAMNRGDVTAVLGELHVAWLTVDSQVLVRFHPDPDALRAAVRRDLGRRVVLLYPPEYPEFTGRLAPALAGADDEQLAYADGPAPTLTGALPLAGLTASLVEDELVARAPDGRSWPVVELFGPFLSALAADAFKLATLGAHTPRISVDRLVVQRETWRTTVGASRLGDTGPATEAQRYLAARRWRDELGLPERVFVKVGTEAKPVFVDLTSPASVAALVDLVRSADRAAGGEASMVITELLPAPDQAWVPDAQGRRYFSELRLTVRDPVPAAAAAPAQPNPEAAG